MENEYLWDKTGEDKEIEQIENALKQFRYQPTAPPVLPIKILQVEEKRKFSFLSLKFAIAGFACLTILFGGLGIWLNLANNKIGDVADLSKPIVTPIEIPNEPIVETIETEIPSTPKFNKTVVDKKPIPPKNIIISKPIQIVSRQTKATPKVKPNKEIKLTDEERFAYNQLMLALSITGEKLKEVKDKANSVEGSLANKSLR